MFGAMWLITFKQWRAHRLRVALTTLGIALGVAVFFAIRTGNATLLDSLRGTVEKLAGKAKLQIAAGESGFSEKVLDTVRATPGVQLAEPVIETLVQTSFADEGTLLVLGVDTAGDQQLLDYQFDRTQTQIADPLVFLAQPDSILLSRAFADRCSDLAAPRRRRPGVPGRRHHGVARNAMVPLVSPRPGARHSNAVEIRSRQLISAQPA